MKKTFAFILYFFVFFNFIKPPISQAATTYEIFSKQYMVVDRVNIFCLDPQGYISSSPSPEFAGSDRSKCEKLIDCITHSLTCSCTWDLLKEIDGDSYILQSYRDIRWLGMSQFFLPKLTFLKNSDGSFKIKNYNKNYYLKVDQDGYLTTSENEDEASDFIFEPIRSEKEYNYNEEDDKFCNIF